MKIIRGLFYKYRELSVPVKASLWFMVMSILQKGIQFIVTPIYTRLLTSSEYGYYSLYTSWSSVILVIATLNLGGSVFNNGMLKYENDRYGFLSSMQGLGNVATIAVFAVIFATMPFVQEISGLHWNIFFCIFVVMLVNPAFSCWTQMQRYTFSYKALSVITLITSFSIPLLGVVFIKVLNDKQYAVIYANVIVQFIVGIVFYIRNLRKGKKWYNREYWRFAFCFSVPLIPHYLSTIILGQADRIMINAYCGADKVGVYSLTYSISLLVNVVISAITSSFVPWVYRKMEEKKFSEISRVSNRILFFLAVVVLVGILFAPELISILGTDEYMEAKWIVAPVMLSCFFTMVYSLFANIEFYFEQTTKIMIASVFAAVSNIILNAIFIPLFGYIAAGYTTLACYFILAVMHYLFMVSVCSKKNIKCPYIGNKVFGFSIILVFICLLAMTLYLNNSVRYIVLFIILIILYIKRDKIVELFISIRKKG